MQVNGKTSTLTTQGFSLLEVLVSITILSVIGLSLVRSTITSMTLREKIIRDNTALELALDTLENYASVNPSTLDDSADSTTSYTVGPATYSVTIDVSVNSDSSRTVDVSVSCPQVALGGNAYVSGTFTPWGEV